MRAPSRLSKRGWYKGGDQRVCLPQHQIPFPLRTSQQLLTALPRLRGALFAPGALLTSEALPLGHGACPTAGLVAGGSPANCLADLRSAKPVTSNVAGNQALPVRPGGCPVG